jgi:hypothetical protein
MDAAMPQVIIANALKDGRVVFLADRGRWVHGIADGLVAQTEIQADRLVQTAARAEADNKVVAPELIEVTSTDGKLRPLDFREAIRANGPTVNGNSDSDR